MINFADSIDSELELLDLIGKLTANRREHKQMRKRYEVLASRRDQRVYHFGMFEDDD